MLSSAVVTVAPSRIANSVKPVHRLLQIAAQYQRQVIEGLIYGLFDQLLIAARGLAQHVTGDLAGMAGVADTQAQALKLLAAQLRDGVAQAIVAAVSSPLFQTYRAGWQIQFVVGDEDIFRVDLVKTGQRSDALATSVHEGQWL